MTRRLEPLERVAEPGDASVPFSFDVHAMIYSEDALTLEAALHKRFDDRRIKLVNLRKEYFNATLPEVIAAVSTHFGSVTFVLEANAEQSHETLALRAEKAMALVA